MFVLVVPVTLEAQVDSADRVGEIKALVATAPDKRTKEQKERIRDIWRSSQKAREVLGGAAVLQKGDSIFDFPGLIHGKNIEFDAAKREYSMSETISEPSADGGRDRWDVRITFSEAGIVTSTHRLKMNSR